MTRPPGLLTPKIEKVTNPIIHCFVVYPLSTSWIDKTLSDPEALNDDLPSTLTVHQVAETRSSHDRPVDANMASIEHYLQNGVRIDNLFLI